MMKKLTALLALVVVTATLLLTGCSTGASAEQNKFVGKWTTGVMPLKVKFPNGIESAEENELTISSKDGKKFELDHARRTNKPDGSFKDYTHNIYRAVLKDGSLEVDQFERIDINNDGTMLFKNAMYHRADKQ